MKKVIEIRNLNAGYNGRNILRDLSLNVSEGEIVGLFGHNGAGKTTILKSIVGLLPKHSGEINMLGKVVYLPQNIRVFPNLTVKENILVVSEMQNVPEYVWDIFPSLRLKQNILAKKLSGGQQQMVALARAIISQPGILLLDEPSLGLSPKLVMEVFEVIKTINQKRGTSILIAEHNILSLSKILSKSYFLEKGKVK
jgi:branched-chain amino acid transport system ATP-binding protein